MIEKVETLVQNDGELRKLTEAIQTAVQAQPGAVVNMTKLADKIGVVNQGPIDNQTMKYPAAASCGVSRKGITVIVEL